MTHPTRAVDASPFVVTPVIGEPMPDLDLDALAEQFAEFYEAVGRPKGKP